MSPPAVDVHRTGTGTPPRIRPDHRGLVCVIHRARRRRTGSEEVRVVTTLTRRRAEAGWILPNRSHAAACATTVPLVEPTGPLLTARIAAGDDRALAEAYDLVAGAVHAAATQVLGSAAAAQDVVQDVFVELWCHPEKYDEARGSLRTYLSVCARRRALDLLRSELRRAGREDRHERLVPPQREPSPSEQVTAAETSSAVHEAVRMLPPDQRQVVELAYF